MSVILNIFLSEYLYVMLEIGSFLHGRFDDGDELDSIEDYFVMKKVDYLLSTRKRVDRDDGCDSDSDSDDDGDQWIGVRNKFDENSVDEYFRTMG